MTGNSTGALPAAGLTNPPLISVCMPVYNAGRYLAKAVESILTQTLTDFEFIIIDDGSSDGSSKVLNDYAARDPRIRLTRRPNRGLVTTLNELIDQARGEFIARMDADDIALPERFQKQVDYLRDHPECLVVGCKVWIIDPDGDPLGECYAPEEHEAIDAHHLQVGHGTAVSHPCAMMRRSAILMVGKYRNFGSGEEVDLFLRLAEYGRLVNLPQVLLLYRSHESNYTSSAFAREQSYRNACSMVRDACQRRNLTMEATPVPPAWASEEPPANREDIYLWWSLKSGHVRTARKYAWRILAQAPLKLSSWRNIYCAIRGY